MKSITEEHEKTLDIVRKAMQKDERCRNDDLWLIISVWQKMQRMKIYIPYELVHHLIKPETITRCRRKIQNDEGVLRPTKPDVDSRRRMNQEEMRRYYAK